MSLTSKHVDFAGQHSPSQGLRRFFSATLILLLMGVFAANSARAEPEAFEIVTSPSALPFVKVIADAANVKDFKMTEMDSYVALEDLCANKFHGGQVLVVTAMPITPGLAATCADKGVSQLFDAQLGFLTLVLVQKASDPALSLTSKQLYQALAKRVPDDDELVENTSQQWSDIDPALPETAIKAIVAPHPATSRAIFDAEALVGGCRQFPVIQNIFYSEPRVEACTSTREAVLLEVDDPALRLDAIREAEPGAVGLISKFAFDANKDWLRIVPFEGKLPTPQDINAEDYNLTSPIYVYADRTAVDGADKAGLLRVWLDEALGEAAIGETGYLSSLGFTFIPSATREWQRQSLSQ